MPIPPARISRNKINLSDFEIVKKYLGITTIPITIKSPLREDKNPSFRIFSRDGISLIYKDFSTGEAGNIITLLSKYWGLTYQGALRRIYDDIPKYISPISINNKNDVNLFLRNKPSDIEIEVIIKDWDEYSIDYWLQYGITLDVLKESSVYPINGLIFIRQGLKTYRKADKLAFVFYEYKEGNTTIKVYQPYSKKMKWLSKHTSDVISLWTTLPEKGAKVIICSSLKDALCVKCATGIPTIALQGEGYTVSNRVIRELKQRFNSVYILFDNDEAGKNFGKKLAKETDFIYIELPNINNNKDCSDLYKDLNNKESFNSIIINLLWKEELSSVIR